MEVTACKLDVHDAQTKPEVVDRVVHAQGFGHAIRPVVFTRHLHRLDVELVDRLFHPLRRHILKLSHVLQRFAVTLGHNAEAGRRVTSNFDGNAPEESFQVVEHADHSSKRISKGNYLSLSSAEADILL